MAVRRIGFVDAAGAQGAKSAVQRDWCRVSCTRWVYGRADLAAASTRARLEALVQIVQYRVLGEGGQRDHVIVAEALRLCEELARVPVDAPPQRAWVELGHGRAPRNLLLRSFPEQSRLHV